MIEEKRCFSLIKLSLDLMFKLVEQSSNLKKSKTKLKNDKKVKETNER